MKWVAQIRHVAAKDVRHSRWTLIAYAALILITTLSIVTKRAFGPYSPTTFASYSSSSNVEVLGMQDSYVMVLPFIVVVLGLALTASLVQMDSPTRVDAFWASRPLTPSAVFSAKLLAVLVVVALPLVGGAAALATLDAHGSTLRGTLAHAGLSFGEWALAAIVIGALTDDLRTSLVVLVGILVGMLALGTILDFSVDVPVGVIPVFGVVGVVGGVSLVAYLYRTRDRRLLSWIVGVVAAACLIIGSFTNPGPAAAAVSTIANGPPLELERQSYARSWGQGRELPMQVHAAPNAAAGFERLDFRPDSASITLLDGKTVRANVAPMPILVHANPPAVGRPVRWLLDNGTIQWSGLDVEPGDLDRPAIAAGVRSVEVGGAVTVSRSRVIGTLPLTSGASLMRDGRRLAIYGFSHDNTGADLWIQMSAVPRPSTERAADFRLRQNDDLQFALVNEARGEALLLTSKNGSGGSGSVVLPWISVTTTFSRFTTSMTGGPPPAALPRDDAWYAGAHLVVIEWYVAGRYRAHATAVIPKP